MRNLAVLPAVLVAAASILAAVPTVATAATPCWKKVIQDWSDHGGTIQGRYSPHCLRQAIKHAPEDLRDYSSVIDDISALLYEASGPQGGNGTGPGPGQKSMNDEQTAAEQAAAAKEQKRRANEAVPDAGTSHSIPRNSRSLPLPLLILGAIALAAALAAAAPPLIKRLRTRFPRLRPAAESVRPPT
jgi:hypothetical protein